MELLLATLPFLLIFLLLIVFRMPAVKAMPLVFLATLALLAGYWRMTLEATLASGLASLLVFLELFLIILFAVLLINIYKETEVINKIEKFLASISPDYRVQAMLIAWAFVALIEGAAGFGTPVALAAPFLVMLGFPVVKAIIIGLIGDSTAVTFGAAGTPIIMGFTATDLTTEQIASVVVNSALIHLPLAMVATLAITYVIAEKGAFKEFIPFAVFSALAFTIPFTLTAIFIGPELPSIVGGIIAMILISIAGKYNFLTPKNVVSFTNEKQEKTNLKSLVKPLTPFIAMILALIITRNVEVLNNFFSSFQYGFENILGTGIGESIQPLFTPYFYFLIAILIAIPLFKANKEKVRSALFNSLDKIKYAMITLVFVLFTAQLILNSDINNAAMQGMTSILAEGLSSTMGSYYIYLSPFVGALGTFVTGSSTVSNILLTSIQVDTAITVGGSAVLMASLQAVGSAAGNMFALHNIVTASAVVGLKEGEGEIIKYNTVIAAIYCLLAGIMGALFFL